MLLLHCKIAEFLDGKGTMNYREVRLLIVTVTKIHLLKTSLSVVDDSVCKMQVVQELLEAPLQLLGFGNKVVVSLQGIHKQGTYPSYWLGKCGAREQSGVHLRR